MEILSIPLGNYTDKVHSQRKSTIEQNELHVDCVEAYNMIKSGIHNYESYVEMIEDILDNVDHDDEI